MKSKKYFSSMFTLLVITVFSLSSCLYIDTDDDNDDDGNVSITVGTPDNSGSVTVGDKLTLKIIANDNDGVKKITLQIPNLGIDKIYTTTGEDIEINDIFIIEDNDVKGLADIIVNAIDEDSNKIRRTDVVIVD